MNLNDLVSYFLTGLGLGVIIGLILFAIDLTDDQLFPLTFGLMVGSICAVMALLKSLLTKPIDREGNE